MAALGRPVASHQTVATFTAQAEMKCVSNLNNTPRSSRSLIGIHGPV